ncbi:DUF6600 domain-containing protein [Ancylobacter defluvii]|uniref:Uncharacterized protein n=1 Tax=Ancylobacter defluvii TaxID=1282440 RepID=A0A9W6N9G0_9HYPH|nr:DUF6600 domain-containing protein [Ancylobacter defluvii]MBS7587779.1 hypothetical protein [Ancylobacter defluvii]GLK82588.1 hypothetical protein GCM10017653_06570 [Ancylobacter defluvii]
MLRLSRPILAMGLAASLLSTAAVLPAIAQTPPPAAAPAGPPPGGASLDVNVFYDQLGDYGSWVEHPDYQYVFIPSNVAPGWRPYQEGRWVWTDAYGWYWESYEPFGWATYHYGRWGYDPAYGWFWVPGDTWAPAWVTWRRGGGRTGWAPIAPERPGYAVGRAAQYSAPVAESWVFVEDRYMGEEDLSPYVAPIPAIGLYLEAAPDYYEPSWDDGYYVNRGFGADVYGPPIRERIVSREVVYVDRQDELFYDAGRLGIFAPFIAFGDRLAPPPRYERRIDPDRRPLIRQYVREGRNYRGQPGLYAPSAALLGALEPEQRRELRQRRYGDPDGYRRDIDRIERERADRIRELRREADSRADTLERERRQSVEQRRQQVDRIRAEQRARAERVNARPDAAPGARPGMPPGARPGVPPGAGPAPRPGMPPDPRPDAARGNQQQEIERRRAEQDRQRQQQDQQRQQMEQRRQQADQQRQQQDRQRQQMEQRRQQADQQRQQQDRQRQQMEQRRQQADQQRQQQDRQRQQMEQRRQQADQQRQQQDQRRQQMEQRRQQADQQRQQQDQRRQQMEQRRQQGDQQRQQQQDQRRQQMEQRRQQADQQRQQQEQRRGPPQQQGGGGGGDGKPQRKLPQPNE